MGVRGGAAHRIFEPVGAEEDLDAGCGTSAVPVARHRQRGKVTGGEGRCLGSCRGGRLGRFECKARLLGVVLRVQEGFVRDGGQNLRVIESLVRLGEAGIKDGHAVRSNGFVALRSCDLTLAREGSGGYNESGKRQDRDTG